jgi:uncharacterized HAD superfamily protein/hypoxanthine phosphoribosyltransferase
MYYRNISDLNQIILKRLHIIPRDFDLIVGIPRSGMMPANLLAFYLNKPYTDIHSFINGHIYKAGARGQFFDIKDFKKVLVVDDSIASGSAIIKAKESLKELTADFDISYCAIYVIPGKEKMVDYLFEVVPLPRYFQWNILNHTVLEKACFDIGVLCVDPTEEQNDDGPKYIDFILNAPPLFVPGCKIGTIVTSRLEKYRNETIIWLEKNNIKYRDLVMLDLPDKRARQKANNHAAHKAKTYNSSNEYVLFVESSLSQAIEINKLTKKPVFCTENFEMIFEAQSLSYNIKSGKYFPFLRRIALKLRNKLRNR